MSWHVSGTISHNWNPLKTGQQCSALVICCCWSEQVQCSAKALEKWGKMTHTIEKYGDIGNFSGVTYILLPFVNLKFVGTWAPTAKMIGDIPDFNVLNVPKMQPRHNPEVVEQTVDLLLIWDTFTFMLCHATQWWPSSRKRVYSGDNGLKEVRGPFN